MKMKWQSQVHLPHHSLAFFPFHLFQSSKQQQNNSSMAIFFMLVVAFFFGPQCSCSTTTFTLTNDCDFTVWPGVLSNAGGAAFPTTGFALETGESKSLEAPVAWSGRFWGRTLCSADPAGRFGCGTGDCGSGEVECSGSGAAPPATLAEFTLGGGGGDGTATDYYDVSLVDGYNLPMLVAPRDGGCGATGCAVDVDRVCPSDLKVVARSSAGGGGGSGGVACKSACEAFGSPEYCCSGAYGNPETCKPSAYSELFKKACPRAYSYAFDDATSTFTCAAAGGYLITFCPSSTSQKSSGQNQEAPGWQPSGDNGSGAMVFVGGGGGGGGGFDQVAAANVVQATALAATSCLATLAFSSWRL